MEDLANPLLAERRQSPAGKDGASTVVKHRSELKIKLTRKYNYRRAECEDSEAIQSWFWLAEKTKAKYDVLNEGT